MARTGTEIARRGGAAGRNGRGYGLGAEPRRFLLGVGSGDPERELGEVMGLWEERGLCQSGIKQRNNQ